MRTRSPSKSTSPARVCSARRRRANGSSASNRSASSCASKASRPLRNGRARFPRASSASASASDTLAVRTEPIGSASDAGTSSLASVRRTRAASRSQVRGAFVSPSVPSAAALSSSARRAAAGPKTACRSNANGFSFRTFSEIAPPARTRPISESVARSNLPSSLAQSAARRPDGPSSSWANADHSSAANRLPSRPRSTAKPGGSPAARGCARRISEQKP